MCYLSVCVCVKVLLFELHPENWIWNEYEKKGALPEHLIYFLHCLHDGDDHDDHGDGDGDDHDDHDDQSDDHLMYPTCWKYAIYFPIRKDFDDNVVVMVIILCIDRLMSDQHDGEWSPDDK